MHLNYDIFFEIMHLIYDLFLGAARRPWTEVVPDWIEFCFIKPIYEEKNRVMTTIVQIIVICSDVVICQRQEKD